MSTSCHGSAYKLGKRCARRVHVLEGIVPGFACIVNGDVVAAMGLVYGDITLRKYYKATELRLSDM